MGHISPAAKVLQLGAALCLYPKVAKPFALKVYLRRALEGLAKAATVLRPFVLRHKSPGVISAATGEDRIVTAT